MLLKEVKKLDPDSCESTEDMLAEIHDVNDRTETILQEDEKLMVGSLDVKALYPSIDVDFAAEVVANELYKSDIKIDEDSIDAEELGLYLILTVDEDELKRKGIRDHCPSRIHNKGRKPNVTGQAGNSKENRKAIWFTAKDPNPDCEKLKLMICKALEVGIKRVMSAHVYKFEDKMMRQKKGGAIGLEMTGELAGVFMCWWDKMMKKKLMEDGVNIQLYKRYVDDINIVIKTKKDESEESVMTKIKDIGDSIHNSIKLEADFPSRYEDQKVPILDLKVWINRDNKIVHEYYMKAVSSKAVVNSDSAMPMKDRRTVLTQEILRIILRCSPLLPWEKVKTHIEDYMRRMQFSGYNETIRKQVLQSAAKAYKKIMVKVERGERPLYRKKHWSQAERMKKKRKKRENWYKAKRDKRGKEYMSVLFVQPTKNSALKKKYEEIIDKSECSIKVVERAGTSVKSKLQKSYPFPKSICDEKCFVCQSEGKGNCRRCNITYDIQCTRQGCKYVYQGETCRNAYVRGGEHLKGLERREQDSVFVQHIEKHHNSDFSNPPCHGFKMSVNETHKTALSRLVTEAVNIEKETRPLLNRKSGYRVNTVLSLSTLSDVTVC